MDWTIKITFQLKLIKDIKLLFKEISFYFVFSKVYFSIFNLGHIE